MVDVGAHERREARQVGERELGEIHAAHFRLAHRAGHDLVRKGLAFRDAHEAVARAVREAEARRVDLADLPLADLARFSPLVGPDVYDVLTLEGSVASRDHPGGTAPRRVREAAAAAREAIAREAEGR